MYKPFRMSDQAQDVIRAIVDFSTRHDAKWLGVRASSGRKLLSAKAPFDADAFIRAVDYEHGTIEFTICFENKAPRFYRVVL